MTYEEACKTTKEFEKEYFHNFSYVPFMSACGTKGGPDEFYIYISLSKALPKNLALPKEYNGLKVKIKIIGEIRAF